MKKAVKMKKNRRGISPVVATVLLVSIVIIIGLIIFLWFRGMNEEVIKKFGEKNIKLVCEDVEFTADYDGTTLYISNLGNVPIFKMNVIITGAGTYSTKDLSSMNGAEDWKETGLNSGGAFSGNIQNEVGGAEKITLIPVLIGNSDKGKKTYVCDDRFGYDLNVNY